MSHGSTVIMAVWLLGIAANGLLGMTGLWKKMPERFDLWWMVGGGGFVVFMYAGEMLGG